MQNTDTLALMRKDVATTLRQAEQMQATAAALVQWYTYLGGDSWANGVTDAEWTAAGITKVQFKRPMADLGTFASILNPVALGNVGDAPYKVQLIG